MQDSTVGIGNSDSDANVDESRNDAKETNDKITNKVSRREFLQMIGATSVLTAASLSNAHHLFALPKKDNPAPPKPDVPYGPSSTLSKIDSVGEYRRAKSARIQGVLVTVYGSNFKKDDTVLFNQEQRQTSPHSGEIILFRAPPRLKPGWYAVQIKQSNGVLSNEYSWLIPEQPIRAFAELHCHPMSHLAFGGRLLWGKPDGEISKALGWCNRFHGPAGSGLNVVSGAYTLEPLIGVGIEGFGHRIGGYPEFDGWPKFTSKIHQQMYIDWIERAYEGGLRLMVALAVNNEFFAHQVGGRHQGDDDKSQIEMQVAEIKKFASAHSDWMEVAYTPQDAHRILQEDKLVIVLGVEVDSLGNWHHENECNEQQVREYLKRLHDIGVRHIFPIHLTNNAFGGCAIYNDLFNVVNHYVTGSYYDVDDAKGTGIQFKAGENFTFAAGIFSKLLGRNDYPAIKELYKQVQNFTGHINNVGLTRIGKYAINEMMHLGFIVDTDHMGWKSLTDCLAIAEARQYPLVAGHTSFLRLALTRDESFIKSIMGTQRYPNEFLRSDEQIERIRRLGGIIAIGLHQGDCRDSGQGKVPNDCAGSSKTWAQQYLYALKLMQSKGIALGTDFNGLAGSSGPRFGTLAASEIEYDEKRGKARETQVAAQTNGVKYQHKILDYREHRFPYEDPKAPPLGPLYPIYTLEERDIWEAIAIYKAGIDPDTAEQPPVIDIPIIGNERSLARRGFIGNIAWGFTHEKVEDLLNPESVFRGRGPMEQRAAFDVKNNRTPLTNNREFFSLYMSIKKIWDRWHAMESGNNVPLVRSRAGRRDFDINLDGVAHFGLLPDFIEDLKNVGLTEKDLQPLYRSSYDYVEMWEKCITGIIGDGPIWIGDFDGNKKDELLVYSPIKHTWLIGKYDNVGTNPINWSVVANTAEFGNLADGRPIWIGDFDGNGRADVLIYSPGDSSWRLGRFSDSAASNQIEWSVVANTAEFGNLADGRPIWIGDFDGNGRADVLIYSPGDSSWRLGRFSDSAASNQIEWSVVANTAEFGNLADGRPIWIGDFDGNGRADVLIYSSGDSSWRLGRFSDSAASNQIEWSVVANTAGFGNLADGRPIWIGDFDGNTNTSNGASMLLYTPSNHDLWLALYEKSVPRARWNWWRGSYDKNNHIKLSLVANTAEFGNLADGRPIWIGDFDGNGRADVLIYSSGDSSWRLGRFNDSAASNQIEWSVVANTAGFGNLADGRPIWIGDFDGNGRADVLIYSSGDSSWRLGRFSDSAASNQIEWSVGKEVTNPV